MIVRPTQQRYSCNACSSELRHHDWARDPEAMYCLGRSDITYGHGGFVITLCPMHLAELGSLISARLAQLEQEGLLPQ